MGRLADRDSAARGQRHLASASNPADFSEALARGLTVLSAFDSEQRRLTQADLARRLDLSRAAVRRAVLTLEHLGYLTAEGRTYRLDPHVLHIASSYLTSNPISAVMQPVCERICADLQESCSAAVLDGADAVIVARAVPNRLIAVGSNVGYRTPADISSLGKVLIAHLPSAEASGYRVSAEEAEAVRRDGYCYVADDVEVGSHSIAVPLRRSDGRVLAALHVGCRIDRIPSAQMHGPVLDLLQRAAQEFGENPG